MEPLTTTANKWTFTQRIIFRFFFAYFVLYCFPFPLDAFEFTQPIAKPYHDLRYWSISKIANLFFNIEAGSIKHRLGRDNIFNFILLFVSLFFSLLVSLIWSFADRHRTNYEKLDQWFRLYLRYYLAFFMFSYGFDKLYPNQSMPISESRLALPYGLQQPKFVLWHFLGYSKAYTIFSGCAEVVGGLLLLWRRTVTIGAFIVVGVMSMVVMMNFCYGISVKLFSAHLLLIAILLLCKDRRRLVNLFFLNKPVDAVPHVLLINHHAGRNVFMTFQVFLVACMLYKPITENRGWYKLVHDFPRPLNGIYDTEYFIRGADTLSPLQTDSLRWKRLIIDDFSRYVQLSSVQLSTDSVKYCNTTVDTVNKEIRFQFKAGDLWGRMLNDSCRMVYSLPDSNHLFLQGIWKNDSIQVMMKKYDLNNYPLYREKFQWIYD